MQEMWVQSLGQEDPLEKEMATHSSVLAREIPWTEELESYSPWGHTRVRHDLVTKQQQTLPFPSFLFGLNLFLFFRILKAKAYIIDFLLLSHKNLKL